MQENYIVGIYARLSRDDERAGESVSIENQKEMLSRYVREQGWTLYDYYCDDGVSGTTFDRPGLNRLVQDATDHKINLVLCKDLSRLGRDYIEAGKYTDFVFPSLGCRFIALNDGVDTLRKNNEMLVILKNVMKNISHSGKVSNDFSLFRRFCCINRCFRCSCGKFSIVHGVQAAIGFQAVAIGEKGDLPETHPVQPRTESKRPCRLTRAKPASKGSDRALSV
ncbi:recombinase family protein [Intestinimonas massiliensis]|nr:recombinase family protein [Intestinimonas massiliensis (ex Afouda et al. 2020)]MCQ4807845.1 recombinase family protein [Intestinimonas massiliensis (ex Afouda et al. 2020)]